jgi:tRNA pseudouridine65 synthase
LDELLILYRDEALIAIHKPAGLLVHPSRIAAGDRRCAMKMLRDQIGQWVYPVHRLDRPTSGVLLFALLAAVGLRFLHPLSADELVISAAPEAAFAAVIDGLGWSGSFSLE